MIRKLLGLRQDEFADRMNAIAVRCGLDPIYTLNKVSRMEIATRDVTLIDAIVVAQLDPQRRGVEWVGLGDDARRLVGAGSGGGQALPPGSVSADAFQARRRKERGA